MGRFIQKMLVISVIISLFQGVPLPFLGPISSASAAVPNIINYQSRLRNPSFAPITALTEIQFTLYNDISAGTPAGAASSLGPVLWKEVHDGISCPKLQPDADGYFSVQLGACTPFPSYITWNNPLYLGVKIEADAEAAPRVLLGAHQYALNSQAVNGFTASTTAQANSLLALDASQNFNIATGTFLGTGLNISSTSTLQNVTFTVATGTSLELTNYLSIGAIHLDQTGTSNLTSGAYLVGVFDEFTNSSATTVQSALRDFDLAINAVSSSANATSTLQRAYNGGGIGLGNTINLATSTPVRIVTTDPSLFSTQNGIEITQANNSSRGLVFGKTNFGNNFSNFGMSDDVSNVTGASGVFAYYNHGNNVFGFSLLGQGGAAKGVMNIQNTEIGNSAAFEFTNQATVNNTGIVRLRNIQDAANTELHVGMGSPEGIVNGDISSLFFQRDGSASGTQVYVKTQNSNNQGWVGLATVDMLNAASSATTTLQSAYDGGGSALGRTITTVAAEPVHLIGSTNTSGLMSWNPMFQVTGDGIVPNSSTSTGSAVGLVSALGYISPARILSSDVSSLTAATSVLEFFNADPSAPFYQLALVDGPNGFNTLGLFEMSPTLVSLTAGTGAALTLNSDQNAVINSTNGQIIFQALGSPASAFEFLYNSSTGNGIRLLNNGTGSSLNTGSYLPEGTVTADTGSLFMRVDGTASGTYLYVKSSNATNTGWLGVATVDMLGNVGGANNGLSVSGTEVILGGTLYQDTIIDGNSGAYNLIVQDVKNFDFAGGGVGAVGSISNTGLILTGTGSFQLRTPNYLTASTGSVLTLVNPATGEVEYATSSITEADTLQTVTDRGNQTTTTIQFAGGTSTGNLIVLGSLGVGNQNPFGKFEVSTSGTAFPNGWGSNMVVSGPVAPSIWLNATNSNNDVILGSQAGAFYLDATSGTVSNGYMFSILGNGLTSINPNNTLTGAGLIVNAGTSNPGAALSLAVQNNSPWIETFNRTDIANSTWNTWIDTSRRFQWNTVTAGYVMSIDHDNGNIRIGNSFSGTASSKLHIDSQLPTTAAILTLQNAGGDIQQFVTTGTPEGSVTGSIGDTAVDSINGRLYIKESGTSTNTGWVTVSTGTTLTASTAFVQNGNSFATSARLGTNDAQSLTFITSGTARGTFDTDGGLSLNNTASDRFFLTTTNTVDDNNYLLADGSTTDYLLGFQTGRFLFKNVTTNQDMLSFSHLTNTLTLGTASTGITQSVITMPNASTNLSIGANSSRKFYVRDDTAGVVRLFVRNSNVLSTDTTNYESLVTANNDIPNRKFVTEYVTSTAFVQNGNSFGTTTSLGTNDANALRFMTSGTEAMRILNTGFVGIGSSTPSTLFAVAGTSTLQDVNPAGPYTGNMSAYNLGTSTTRWNSLWAGVVNVGTSTWSLSQNASNNFAIFNGPNKTGNEVITIDTATENIGFGTMSQGITPQARLHVLGGDVLMGGNANEEIFKLDPIANTVSLGDYSGWNANTYLQVDDNARKVIIPNGTVGIGTTQPRSQFDVAGLTGQNALDTIDQTAGTVFVTTQGAYAYVLNQEANELSIVNISRPNRLEQAGVINISKRPSEVIVQGQYAYVTAHDTDVLYVIDISDAMNPVQIGSLGLTGGSPKAISIQGKYAYIVEEGGDRMEVVDISDPAAMNSVTTVGICREPVRVKANGRYVYAICADSSLAVVDVQDPSSPNLITTVGTGRNPKGMDIRGRYLYVTASDDKQLDIFDLIRPTEPRLITNFDVCSGPMGVNVQANRAYVTCNIDNTLRVVDVSNPARPEIVGTDDTEKAPAYLTVQGRYAYIPTTDGQKLQSFDLGGGYLQQLQVAGIEGDDLSVLQTANIGEVVVQRGLSVGGSAKVDGEFTVSGGIPGRSTPFTINQEGRVGIGTLTPDQLLSVNGDASKIGGGTWSTFSDERLKKDISPYEDGLALITKINPVHFTYNGLGGIATGTKSYVGVLAQDIQQVAPYMVATTSVMLHKSDTSPTEVLTFDPNAITYALINSVKELNAKVGAVPNNTTISVTTTAQEMHLSGPVLVGQDTVGQAKILSGSKAVQVNFAQPYSVQPIVTISPMDFVDAMYRVTDVTTSGFTIQLNQTQSGDRLFSWHAFGGEGAKVYVSDGTSSTLELIEATPAPSSAPVPDPMPAPSEVVPPVPNSEQVSSTSSTGGEAPIVSENTSSTEPVNP